MKIKKVYSTQTLRGLFGPKGLDVSSKDFALRSTRRRSMAKNNNNVGSTPYSSLSSGLGMKGNIIALKDVQVFKKKARSSAQTGTAELSASTHSISAGQPTAGTILANRSFYVIPEHQVKGCYEKAPPLAEERDYEINIEPMNQSDLSIKQDMETNHEPVHGRQAADPVAQQANLRPEYWNGQRSKALRTSFNKLLGSSSANGMWKSRQSDTNSSSNQEALIQNAVHNYLWSKQRHNYAS